jgi:hypothetical protein
MYLSIRIIILQMKTNILLFIASLVFISTACEVKKSVKENQSPVQSQEVQSQEELIKRGSYLVEIAGCNDCHSPKIMTAQGPVPDPARRLSGHPASNPAPTGENLPGVLFDMNLTSALGPWGTTFAANITPDETGIGNWTYEQFKNALTKGMYKGLENTRTLLPPMPWQNYKNMQEDDIQAIYAYLKSIAPVNNIVPQPLAP